MTKGGYRPQARLEQDLAEIQVGSAVYLQLDAHEDQLIDSLLAWLRGVFARMPSLQAQLDHWEKAWHAADRSADVSVRELGELAIQANGYLAGLATA